MSISVRELLEAGAHFGHQTHRWNPKMRPYIYGARNGIHIIDLQKTAKFWAAARQAIVDTVMRGEHVLFVGTKPQAQEVLKEEALRAGQYYVDRRWLGGMLTNFKTIKTRLDRLEELTQLKATGRAGTNITKKEALRLDTEREKLEKTLVGIKNMTKVPGLIVVIDPKTEHIAIKEARRLQIPIVAVADTNCDPEGVDFIVPANDDAVKSVKLFLASAADACLEGTKALEQRIQEESRRRMEQEKSKAAASAAAAAAAATPVVAPAAEQLAANGE